MIEIVNFSIREIYHDFNLSIGKGITYLKGRNGSGKTTLLDCIAGLDRTYKGTITGNDNCVYLNQNLYFSGRLYARDFIKFIYQLSKIKEERNYYFSKVGKYKEDFDFYKLWDKKISYLSGGEMKLLFFSVISSLEKDIYIFDEPYSGVDKFGKKIINSILCELSDKNKTILVTSHEEEYINALNVARVVELET